MSLKTTKHKAKRRLIGLLMTGFFLLPSAISFAEPVKIHSAIENDRLQIVMDWAEKVSFTTMVDDKNSPLGSEGHELLLQFDKTIGIPNLETLTKKTSAWLESIRAGYDSLLLQSKDKVSYKVSRKGKKIRIEVVRRLPLPPVQSIKAGTDNDLLITFAEKVLADKQTELMHRIFDKHGDGFLMTRPLLAANLMLALKNKSSSLRWMQKAENLPDMTLDQQIEMVALYGKLGQSEKIGKTRHTRKLSDRIARKLNDPKLPKAHKEELIYTLLDLKAHEMVLPHLKQLAYQQGGDWVYPYEETLVELKRNDELIGFYQKYIKHSRLAVDEKRRIAFRFLELNRKTDALPVFKELAESTAAQSPDVEQLLFLWGPRPSKVERKWLANRVNTSKNEERTQWLRHLTNAGGAQEVIQLTGKEPSSSATDSLFSVYLQALEELEDKKTFDRALRQWMESETDPDRLWLYGSLAEDQSQLELANEVYEKILVSRPQDEKALTHLGWNSFYLNQWKDTQKYLQPILTKKENSWTTNYYYAEAIYLEGHISESLPFFQKTLALINKIASPSTEVRMTKAISLERLGRKKEALAIYEHLLKISPTDKKLQVKYISALMEAGDYEQAQNWLTLTAK